MMNWSRFMDGSLVSHRGFMVDRGFMSNRGFVSNWSFMMDGGFVSHWSFVMDWGFMSHRSLVSHRYLVLGERFIVCQFLMVHRGSLMTIMDIFMVFWCIVVALFYMALMVRCLRVSPIVVIDWLGMSREDFSSVVAFVVITVVCRRLVVGHLIVVVVDDGSGVMLNNWLFVMVSNLVVMSLDWVADVMIILLFRIRSVMTVIITVLITLLGLGSLLNRFWLCFFNNRLRCWGRSRSCFLRRGASSLLMSALLSVVSLVCIRVITTFRLLVLRCGSFRFVSMLIMIDSLVTESVMTAIFNNVFNIRVT